MDRMTVNGDVGSTGHGGTFRRRRRRAASAWVEIRPRPGWQPVALRELWSFRDLLILLIGRDVRIRYKQTVLGVIWVILQPLLTTGIFTLLFGRMAGLAEQTGSVPYPLFVFAGLLPWTFFASAVTYATTSVVANRNLITKVYFPRLLLPLAGVGVSLVDAAVVCAALVGLMALYGVVPGGSLLLVPVCLLLIGLTAVGVGSFLAGLSALYRDFIHVVPFGLQVWFYLTPVIYPAQLVPEGWRWLWALNPMTHLIECFRHALLGDLQAWNLPRFLGALVLTAFVAGVGLVTFRRLERRFADLV